MKKQVKFESHEIILKLMTENENQKYCAIRNRVENRKWFTDGNVLSEQEQENWFKQYLVKESDYMFSIYNMQGDFLGGNAIYHIDFVQGIAEYGRLLKDTAVMYTKGTGYLATMAAIAIAKEQLQLQQLYLEVYQDNLVAVKIYERAGFEIKDRTQDSSGREMYKMIIKL